MVLRPNSTDDEVVVGTTKLMLDMMGFLTGNRETMFGCLRELWVLLLLLLLLLSDFNRSLLWTDVIVVFEVVIEDDDGMIPEGNVLPLWFVPLFQCNSNRGLCWDGTTFVTPKR